MVDYILLKNQLRQKQVELRGRQITKIPQRELRTGIQSLPQRKEIARFNKRLREQSKAYGEQIKAIDRYLYLEAQRQKIISELGEDEEVPTFEENLIPKISFYVSPQLKRLRNRFQKGWLI